MQKYKYYWTRCLLTATLFLRKVQTFLRNFTFGKITEIEEPISSTTYIQGGPGLMYAQKPRCPEAQMPRSPDAQKPKSPDAQKPRCPEAQMPRSPKAQMPRRTSIQNHPVQLPRQRRQNHAKIRQSWPFHPISLERI